MKISCMIYVLWVTSTEGFVGVAEVAKEYSIQAESMKGDITDVYPRQNASDHRAVHLYTGQRLQTELCFRDATNISIVEIGYSNDGLSDRIRVTLDDFRLDEFTTEMFSDGGAGWERFRSHKSNVSTVVEGRTTLTVTVVESDKYGVEIDFIKISVNHSQGDFLNCNLSCFENITFMPFAFPSGSARAVQRSVQTKCTEEDNINIPVFYENASTLHFVVTASLPKYDTFQNDRDPDWTNCKMSDAFWRYKDINFSRNHSRQTDTSSLYVSRFTTALNLRPIAVIEIDFKLEGPSTGSIDSEIGTHIYLQNIKHNGTVKFTFQYYGRYNKWSDKQNAIIKSISDTNAMFVTPDFKFREGTGNRVRIEVFTDFNISNSLSIGEIHMYKRPLKPDTSSKVFDDGITIIEGVDIDMWWRINETMSVTITGQNQTFNDFDYIRIYQKIPWAQKRSFSQVLVLYQDANIRLLPTTPYGFDWIPFGSSVIIGQTNPMSNRPCAPIQHLHIDPNLLQLTVFFTDHNVISLTIQTTISETQLHVSASHFVKDTNLYPFFTFRSMYVADGNNDVDHIKSDVRKPKNIMERWNELRGNFFAFYRQCISKHNTQSPDISIQILPSS